MKEKHSLTPCADINVFLESFCEEIQSLLRDNLVGIYLFGSLVSGGFHEKSSDIDLFVAVHSLLQSTELDALKHCHQKIEGKNQKWGKRLECSYLPVIMLTSLLSSKDPRPYVNEGIFYEQAHYGNEWIINNYLLIHKSIPLIGPNFKTLMPPIPIAEVQKACIRDLLQEWYPKINKSNWLDNSYYQAYLVLNLCHILYTVCFGKIGTKNESAAWVKRTHGEPWNPLIESAQQWQLGKEMPYKKEAIQFTQFVMREVKKVPLFKEF
ncbi:aminoglycoside adenylyltransferase domain-containing protein [Candidatus Paracaedibacter symbiosus]|uniref:aminoglycoside adenylyltransferase domain-containing protein n=1 Tax=Candidatus Paracaedibacter symbiosus TaxID=244582 RepID=UPI000509C243|nr:aminoglycoside adenylyltransferase domain-containing protein [Candidatus Paracaedibacter symbiosus]